MNASAMDPFVGRTEPSAGQIVETARLRLWFHDTGGSGEPLVLLGGFTAGHFVFISYGRRWPPDA